MRTAILLVLFSALLQAEGSTVLLHWDFESGVAGDAQLKKLVDRDDVALVPGAGRNGGTALRVDYVGFDQGSKRVVQNIALPGHHRQATLHFAVRFPNGFDFALGGKLHGLGPDHKITGGRTMRPDGWSARFMWHEGGGLKSYLYHQTKGRQYGASTKVPGFHFEPERWYELALEVTVNDPPEAANGLVRMLVDGAELARDEGIQFRAVGGENTLITNFLFSTFHGGNKPTYAPRDAAGEVTTVQAYFDAFTVTAP